MARGITKNVAIMIVDSNLDCPLCNKGKITVKTRKLFSVKCGLEMFNEICCDTCDKAVVVSFDTTTGECISITENKTTINSRR